MAMPGWAMALGVPLYAGKVADSLNDNVKALNSIIDTVQKYREQGQQKEAATDLSKFQRGYEDMAGPGTRFFADPESRKVMQEQGLAIPSGDNPFTAAGLESFRQRGALENQIANVYGDERAQLGANSLAEKQHALISTFETGDQREANRAEKSREFNERQAERQRKVNEDKAGSEFQGAIAGLTGPSKSPYDLAQFSKRGGFAPFDQVESDIRMAGAEYGAPREAVNSAVDDARNAYKETYLTPFTKKVGRTTMTGQENLLGNIKEKVENVAPVFAPKQPKLHSYYNDKGEVLRVDESDQSNIDAAKQAGFTTDKAPTAKKGRTIQRGGTPASAPKPAGKTTSGKDYWIWSDGKPHYSPPGA